MANVQTVRPARPVVVDPTYVSEVLRKGGMSSEQIAKIVASVGRDTNRDARAIHHEEQALLVEFIEKRRKANPTVWTSSSFHVDLPGDPTAPIERIVYRRKRVSAEMDGRTSGHKLAEAPPEPKRGPGRPKGSGTAKGR